ncbi:MAG: iron-sulfur cluster assembly scaffold protein [Acidobacteria bacterium]|nr:iron-sulfur cluster assembly scaffold protein [Acidobacteriota bacterium]
MYSERLLQHFQNPQRAGRLPVATAEVVVMNPACGDELRLGVRVKDGVVEDAAFQVRGCTASIACGSAMAEWLVGRSLAEIRGAQVEEEVERGVDGLPEASRHAAALCGDAVKKLLAAMASGGV